VWNGSCLWGPKNLKAIAVRGTGSVPVADIDGLKDVAGVMFRELMEDPSLKGMAGFRACASDYVGEFHRCASYAQLQAEFLRGSRRVKRRAYERDYCVGDKACFACPDGHRKSCAKRVFAGRLFLWKGRSMETTALIGSNCALKIHRRSGLRELRM